jgi:hypothetical protein
VIAVTIRNASRKQANTNKYPKHRRNYTPLKLVINLLGKVIIVLMTYQAHLLRKENKRDWFAD